MSCCCHSIMRFYWEFKGEILGSMGGFWWRHLRALVPLGSCRCPPDLLQVWLHWSWYQCMHAPCAPNAESWVLRAHLVTWKEIMLCIKLQPALGMQRLSALNCLNECIPRWHSETLTIGLARVLSNQVQGAEEGAPQAPGVCVSEPLRALWWEWGAGLQVIGYCPGEMWR